LDPLDFHTIKLNGNETLSFLRTDIGDTRNYIGYQVDTGSSIQNYRISDCPVGFSNNQYITYYYMCANSNEKFNIKMFVYDRNNVDQLIVQFGSAYYNTYLDDFYKREVNQLQIGTITYDSVAFFNSNAGSDGTSSNYIAYNRKFGFLRIKRDGGPYWDRILK
jgi:hypothetical protein